MVLFGILITALVAGSASFWLGSQVASAKRMFGGKMNSWCAFAAYAVGGVCFAVVGMPVYKWVFAHVPGGVVTVAKVVVVIAFIGLTLVGVADIVADKVPDRAAMVAAKVVPTLMAIALTSLSTVANVYGDILSTYGSALDW
jgi:hypothetical protein